MKEPHDPSITTDLPAIGAEDFRESKPFCNSDPVPGAATSDESRPDVGARATDFPAVTGYRVLREIARGGMGRVLAAHDLTLDRDVALKVLLPGASSDRFVRESKITARLPHPGIPPVYALGTLADSSPFLAMKLVAGRTLAEEMKSADRPRLLQAFTQVCQAVGFAHSRGIIHRDLKPANVMVGAFGEVQVMDWGLAKDLTNPEVGEQVRSGQQPEPSAGTDPNQTTVERPADESTDARTQAGAVMGTPAYMAPEQARGESADARADVFALGGILCAILTGWPPYRGKSHLEVIRRAGAADLGEAHTRLDDCGADAELVALCRSCLSPSPADRPKDGQAVADALTSYLDGVQERLRRAELDRVRMAGEKVAADLRLAEQRRRFRLTLTLAGMAVLLVLGGAVIWVQAQKTWDRQERNADAAAGLLDQVAVALPARDAAKGRVLLEEADKRAEEGGAERWSERRRRLHEDLKVLEALDKVDQFRWSQVESSRPEPAAVASQFRDALVEFGQRPESVSVEEAAARVSDSEVRDRLVTALDWWMRVEEQPSARVRAWVRAVLQTADPDSYRDAVRDAVLKNDLKMMADLVGRAEAAEQPPGFVAFLGESDAIPVERRRELLTLAVRHRTGDLGLFIALGSTYGYRKADAEKSLRWFQAAVGVAPRNSAAHNALPVIEHFDDVGQAFGWRGLAGLVFEHLLQRRVRAFDPARQNGFLRREGREQDLRIDDSLQDAVVPRQRRIRLTQRPDEPRPIERIERQLVGSEWGHARNGGVRLYAVRISMRIHSLDMLQAGQVRQAVPYRLLNATAWPGSKQDTRCAMDDAAISDARGFGNSCRCPARRMCAAERFGVDHIAMIRLRRHRKGREP
jgi:serine/threonine protein kinase